MRLAPAGGFAGEGGPIVARPGPSLAELAAVLASISAPRGSWRSCRPSPSTSSSATPTPTRVVLARDGEVSFAPLYDLISTRFYLELDAEPVQLIAGVDDIDDVRIDPLAAEATAWGLPGSLARRGG